MPEPTDRDRDMAYQYLADAEGLPTDEEPRHLALFLAQARREGREEGIREALAAVKGVDALAIPKMHPFQAGLLRAITAIERLLDQPPERKE